MVIIFKMVTIVEMVKMIEMVIMVVMAMARRAGTPTQGDHRHHDRLSD